MRQRLRKAALAAAVGLAVAIIGLAVYARRSLPDIDGTVTVTGLSGAVDIIRDADSIPHIVAENVADALFGLGYVHAQDRLWQMEFQRRIGHARLSEIFGEAALSQDRFLRTVGFGRAARAAWDHTPDWAQQRVNAYVTGVNAFIASHRGARLPLEFTALRFEPEPWSGVDVLVWIKMMAWDLSGNYSLELLRDDLSRSVGAERMQQLMPPYAASGLSIVKHPGQCCPTDPRRSEERRRSAAPPPIAGKSSSLLALERSLSEGHSTVRDLLLGGALTESLGSNNWVVDGTMSATGKPLLANDPHLSSKLPSTWYLAHLSAGDFDVIGATLPGTPAIALGRNRFIAWGATNVSADVEDLYRERIDDSGRFARFRGTDEALTLVPEVIHVKGADPVHLNVRVTRHGPLITDAINANNANSARSPKLDPLPPLALRWTSLDADDTTLPAFLKLNEARNWNEFTAALRDFVVPSQNFVYADVEGHIGYYAPGRIPIRAAGDGAVPLDGSAGDNEWIGWVPFDELPHLYDPPEHFIVTANHRPAADGYPYTLGVDWPEPYRASRITELLKGRTNLTPDDFARIQADTVSLQSKQLLPLLLDRVRPDVTVNGALELLGRWDGDVAAGSSAAAVFEAWVLKLPSAIVADDLGARLASSYDGRFSFVTRFLINTLGADDSSWCDDARTTAGESCEEIVTTALRQAVTDLSSRLGSDMTRWRWDAVHRATFPHQGFDAVRLLRRLLSRSVPNGGDWSTVNVGSVSTDQPYEQRSVAGYRSIIDLSPANDSRFIIDVGQSGHVLSPYYDSFLEDWREVRHRKMRIDRAQIEEGAIGRLKLRPIDGRNLN
ncbi:MAG TPA: penicillin acylase family protein [Vicinamibacterales bacterium]|nr:penicillin acylase family protein [Vicinamibacterales bacterium]